MNAYLLLAATLEWLHAYKVAFVEGAVLFPLELENILSVLLLALCLHRSFTINLLDVCVKVRMKDSFLLTLLL